MAIEFIDIPPAVSETVKRYLSPDCDNALLCFYGADAQIANSLAQHFIAWGCSTQSGSHRFVSKGCSLPALKQCVQTAVNSVAAMPLALWQQWLLDVTRRQLTHPTLSAIDLTDKETELLHYLCSHAGQTIEKANLLTAIWGYNSHVDTRTLETHIYRLRQKLEATQPAPDAGILTMNEGYSLTMPAPEPLHLP